MRQRLGIESPPGKRAAPLNTLGCIIVRKKGGTTPRIEGEKAL
jgi:hypothetical protein